MEQDVVGAGGDVLHHHVLVAFEHGIRRQTIGIDLHHLCPVNGNTVCFVAFRPGLRLAPFLFRGVVRVGGGGVLDWTLGLPCSPLSRLISSRRRWFSAWAARRSAITSSSMLRSRLTSARACSSTMLCRSRSSSIVPLAPVARGGVYDEPLCQIPSVVATR